MNQSMADGTRTIRGDGVNAPATPFSSLWFQLRRARSLFLMTIALPLVLAVRALRPVVLVRFGAFKSTRLGHFALDTELYLGERDLGMHGPRTVDLFSHSTSISNSQLKKMWDRVLPVSWFVRYLGRVNRGLPGGATHAVRMISAETHGTRDVHGILARTQPHLSFTAEEERQGVQGLQQMGIPEGAPFVCFHARDPAYLGSLQVSGEGAHHNYRDSNIHSYVPAVEKLTRRGFFAIRMGAVVKEALNTSNPMILDYATRNRSEFLDIYLTAKCRFYISSGTGLDAVANLFRRPVAYVNLLPLERVHSWYPEDLTIPKKLWLRSEGRLFTFRETIESGAGRFLGSDQFEELGLEVIENSPEEITALAIEMDERLNGAWQPVEGDEELQRRFWSLYEGSELHGKILSRIGAEFLRQNRALLE